MPIPDLSNASAATNIATFAGAENSSAARIDYDVPLPGAQPLDRVVPIELPSDWFADGSSRAGTSLIELGVVQGDEGRLEAIRADRLALLYRRLLPAAARPAKRLVADAGGDVEPLLSDATGGRGDTLRSLAADDRGADVLERRRIVAEPDDVELQRRRRDSYVQSLADQQAQSVPPPTATATAAPTITVPVAGPGHSVHEIQVDPVASPVPRLALVETWELRSRLGDYGLGRTLQTFSLLPGERTTITVETWRSEAATRDDATTIFDSSDTAAQTRFASTLSRESGSAFQDQGGWSLSIGTSAKGSFNLFSVVDVDTRLDAGFAANHQQASQSWSNSVSQSAQDHAVQANNSRRQAVQASSSSTTESGTATTTVREIANTNLRRVLNFVFRELNQAFETEVVLRDIRVAFYNGRPESAEIAALPDLGRLIRRHIVPDRQYDVARAVLTLCAQRIDADGDIATTLQRGTRPAGDRYEWEDARLNADGMLVWDEDPLSPDFRWRFKRDQELGGRRVDGVVTDRSTVVLRTDNLVVEALLGQADALDPYASALQAIDLVSRAADTEWRNADTRRTTDALELVANAGTIQERIAAWQRLFPQEPEIEVVPVAAVNNNGTPGP
ncbi:MAG TPA: hypothetical protein VH418_14000 [Solirubrobacteraceae bacterium]